MCQQSYRPKPRTFHASMLFQSLLQFFCRSMASAYLKKEEKLFFIMQIHLNTFVEVEDKVINKDEAKKSEIMPIAKEIVIYRVRHSNKNNNFWSLFYFTKLFVG